MADYELKAGDTAPIEEELRDKQGKRVDLTGATVRFGAKLRGGTTVIAGNAVITDAARGRVRYSWAAGQTDAPGAYDCEWQVTLPAGGGIKTFPQDAYFLLMIRVDVAD